MKMRMPARRGLRTMWALPILAILLSAGSASADILKVLERNTLVLRIYEMTRCEEGKPCDKPKPWADATDLRRVGDLIYLINRTNNLGVTYPVSGEIDGRTHPAMKSRMDMDGRNLYNSYFLSGESRGNTLVLKDRMDVGQGTIRSTSSREMRLSGDDTGCDYQVDFETKQAGRPGVRMTFKTSCEIVPIGSQDTAAGKDLVFRGLTGDSHKHLVFKAIGNRYADSFALCLTDNSWGGVAFKLESGTEDGKFHCAPSQKFTMYETGTYTSKVEKDGNRYIVRITGSHFGGFTKRGKLERPSYNYPIEYELRFVLTDGKCTVEHVSARQGKSAFRGGTPNYFVILKSTPESTCGFE